MLFHAYFKVFKFDCENINFICFFNFEETDEVDIFGAAEYVIVLVINSARNDLLDILEISLYFII